MPSISSSPQEEVGQSHLSRHTGLGSEVRGEPSAAQMQGGSRHMVGPQRLRLLLPLLRLDPNHTWFLRRPARPSFRGSARLVVILLHSLSLFTVSILVCHHRPLRRARQPTTLPL